MNQKHNSYLYLSIVLEADTFSLKEIQKSSSFLFSSCKKHKRENSHTLVLNNAIRFRFADLISIPNMQHRSEYKVKNTIKISKK